jgi:hypothetical protein
MKKQTFAGQNDWTSVQSSLTCVIDRIHKREHVLPAMAASSTNGGLPKVKAMHKGVEWVGLTLPHRTRERCAHDVGAIPIGESDQLTMVTDRDIVCAVGGES